MRHLRSPALLAFSALAVACATEPSHTFLGARDTLQTRGALLSSADKLGRGKLVWVPGTDLVAFISFRGTAYQLAVWTVNTATGSMRLVDDDLTPRGGSDDHSCFETFVAAPDGSALYYTAGIDQPPNYEWQLRVADLRGGIRTLRSSVSSPLAVSPDGRYLAYVASGSSRENDSLIVRDLVNGAERTYAA